MKGNNKGFAITAVIYSILVIVIIIMTLVLAIMSSRRQTVEKIQERVKKETSDVKSNNSNNNGTINLNVGDEVCIGGECFYVLSFDDSTYNLFAKYNLYVGRKYTNSTSYAMITTSDPLYGKQYEKAKGDKESPAIGTMAFSDTTIAISNYATYIKNTYGITVTARSILHTELEGLIGCKPVGTGGCSNPKYPWILNTTYWANADPTDSSKAYLVGGDGFYGSYGNTNASYRGARPVIEVSASDIGKFTKA